MIVTNTVFRGSCLAGGILLLAGLWFGPLPKLAHQAFFAHMIMNMGVVALAAPLLALGIAGSAQDPARRAPQFFSPIPASIAELIIVWAFHAPGLHHWARTSAVGLAIEQGFFLLAGLWLWLSAAGGAPGLSQSRAAAGVLGMLLTSMHMTLLGALLALAPRPLYAQHDGWGDLSALQDQHLGGAIMLVAGGLAYLLAGLYLMRKLLKLRRLARLRSKTQP